ncbi:uncharacterized protein APUU_12318A [Aspergillus puulaauensis]|uniref:EKC/KEOPS complex subunit BUD32 n=1 Tax=Aspergillus puulaauensis TaxID=1220207 RepID=A0A7R7XDU0_9EURO|nr:uncharacterized protein APUU_12318A [Aspergillus puulaauensis]BCS19490.1 hypothetical protein APUU_12318A [Aspergillus puulaauensis]
MTTSSPSQHILNANPKHAGSGLVANILDSFTIPGPHGFHTCMVFDPLCEPLWMLQHRFERKAIPLDVLKPITAAIIEGLRYLHEECRVIHTDLTPDNMMMRLSNPAIASSVAETELIEPSPRKQLVDRSIYLSRNKWNIPLSDLGAPAIQGFRNAVHGGKPHSHPIQLAKYQCPEISLGMEWTYPADIWNLGAVLWELFFGRGPFDQPGDPETWTEAAHVAQIISLLGPPPLDVLQRGKRSSQYFDEKGEFKFPDLIQKLDFRTLVDGVQDSDELAFVDFISRFLCWRPEDRPTARELFSGP